MSELCTGVGLCVDASDLVELVGGKLGHEAAGSLGENEDVVLVLEELSNFLVLLNEAWLKSVLESEGEEPNIRNQRLTSVLNKFLLGDALH